MFKLLPRPEIHFAALHVNYFPVMATAFPSGLDLVQSYSLYIHAKHCCGVHYLNSALFRMGPRNFSHSLVPPFCCVRQELFVFPLHCDFSFTTRSQCSCLWATCHISTLPVYTFSNGPLYTGFERVLHTHPQSHANYLPSFKLFPRHPKNLLLQHQTTMFRDFFLSPLPIPTAFLGLCSVEHRAAVSCDHSSHELQGCWKRSSPKIKPVWKVRQGSKPLPYTVGTLDIKATRKMLTYPVMQTPETPKIIVTHQTLHYFPQSPACAGLFLLFSVFCKQLGLEMRMQVHLFQPCRYLITTALLQVMKHRH